LEFHDEVQTLTRLGLTSNQARVYLALVRLGPSTVKTTSKYTNVERSETYRIMVTLEKLALVERIISTPFKFKAITPKHAIAVLMERRTRETSELQIITKGMLQHFENSNIRRALEKDEQQFILIPKKEASIQKRRKAIENAQRSIDVVNSWKRFPMTVFTYVEETRKALQRGVKIRVVTQKPKVRKAILELEEFKKNPNFEVRYIPTQPQAVLSIYDEKEVFMTISATAALGESPTLWSSNPSFLATSQEYFESMWTTAIEEKHKDND
jgi:sugar-specific transcriptional regulator TrmB